jgi:hypothetical protein
MSGRRATGSGARAPTGDHRHDGLAVLSQLAEIGSVVLAAAALALALGVVGAALRVLTRTRMPHLPSAAVTIGLGAAVTSVVVALSFRLTGRSHAALGLLVAASLTVVVVSAVRSVRRSDGRREVVRSWWSQCTNPLDLTALALVLLLLAVPLSLGLTFWTGSTDDFHRYVASAQVWQSDEVGFRDFRDVHTGDFEATQVARALSEKPMSTALLLTASRVIGVEPYAALTPLLIVTMWAGLAATIHLLVRRFRLATAPAVAAAVATTLSLAPVLVIRNAQLGHALVLSLAAVTVAVAAVAAPARSPRSVAVVLAVLLAATLGSNASLVIGFAPLFAATLFWMLRRGGTPRRRSWGVLIGSGATLAVLMAAFVPWVLVSLRLQTTGEAGDDTPLVSPIAFVGLQVSRDAAAPLAQSLVAWAVLTVALLLLVRPSPALVRRHAPFAAVLTAGLLSAVVLIVRWGPNSYIMFKWTLTAIAVVMPLVLAAAVARAAAHRPTRLPELRIGLLALAAVAFAISGSTMRGSSAGARPELLALADDVRLVNVGVLNIDTTDYAANSMAPLLVPSARVVVTRPTYADPEAPVGDFYLVHRDQVDDGGYELLDVLPGRYALARRDVSVDTTETLRVGTDSSRRGVLVGSWVDLGTGRVWARSTVSWVVLDPAGPLSGADLRLTLRGLRLAPGQSPRSLEIRIGPQPLTSIELTAERDTEATLEVPATLVGDDGRLRVRLYIHDAGERSDLKELEYSLESITVTPAGQSS